MSTAAVHLFFLEMICKTNGIAGILPDPHNTAEANDLQSGRPIHVAMREFYEGRDVLRARNS